MSRPELSRTRLFLILVAGGAAGAFSMSIVPVLLVPTELTMLGLLDALFLGVWFLAFAVPIALIVGVPAFNILGARGLLNPASVCITGILAGLATQVVMYGVIGHSFPLGFIVLGGFGGLVAAAFASVLMFRCSNNTVERDARKSGARPSP